MILTELTQLKPTEEQAVIINVGTKMVTTLSLLSTLRYAGMPVLVIDCESKDGSWDYFSELMQTHEFDLISAPLKPHGKTLDWLFRTAPSKKVLLVDSDLEILGPDVLQLIRRFIDDERVFGGGLTHGPCWLSIHEDVGYYQERVWMPITMLKTSMVREALTAGHSFMPKTVFNDCCFSKKISNWLGKRFKVRRMRNWRLGWLDRFKGNVYGQKPSYVFYDTGADLYQYLKYERGFYFTGMPAEVQNYVTHYHGITRLILDSSDKHGTSLQDIVGSVRERLEQIYGVSWSEPTAA